MSLERRVRAPGWTAQYAGRCGLCEEKIEVGQMIEHGQGDGYWHIACPEIAPEKPTKFQGTTLEEMGF